MAGEDASRFGIEKSDEGGDVDRRECNFDDSSELGQAVGLDSQKTAQTRALGNGPAVSRVGISPPSALSIDNEAQLFAPTPRLGESP